MPVVGELPDDLRSLVRRNALELSHYRFQPDSERLIDAVERAGILTWNRRTHATALKRLNESQATLSSGPADWTRYLAHNSKDR
jgi:hypothetical protein